MDYILDTNICIYIIKKKPQYVFEKFSTLPLGSVGISSITMAELQYGVHKSQMPEKNQIALNRFLLPMEIVPFEDNAAIEYGKIRTTLEKSVSHRFAGYIDRRSRQITKCHSCD